MKRAIIAAALCLACAPAWAQEAPAPRTYTISEDAAQDYANRLAAEMRQIQAQFEKDKATLDSIVKQSKPPAEGQPQQ